MKKLSKILIALLCLVLFASCGGDDEVIDTGAGENGAAEESGPTPVSFLQKAETGDRNNYDGSVGYEILIGGSDLQVSGVGRPVSGEMNQAHTIYIWEASSGNLLASAEVTPDSPTDSLGFKTAQLGSPVILKAGETYRIVSSEYADGDMWYDVGTSEEDPIPDLQPSGDASIITPVFTGEGEHGLYPSNDWNPGGLRGYVGATFYYVPVS